MVCIIFLVPPIRILHTEEPVLMVSQLNVGVYQLNCIVLYLNRESNYFIAL